MFLAGRRHEPTTGGQGCSSASKTSTKNMSGLIVHWEQRIQSDSKITVEAIDDFNARGMHRVYGRGDQFKKWRLNLDVWRNREGKLFARFWSRSNEVDRESWEVTCLAGTDFPFGNERWVPQCLRDRYDSWVTLNV